MKPTIALFIADPKCSVQSGNGIMRALGNYYNFKIFSKNELEDNFFDDIDMIVIPGGFGDSDSYDTLFKHNAKRVRKFVKDGGKYLGICMGAYWAGKHYLNILDNIDVVQYITQPDTCTRRPHAKNMSIEWKTSQGIESYSMFFYDGATFLGNGKCDTIAKYAVTHYPMAIVQGNIGLIGCHPESEEFWYDSYNYMKGKYHKGQHHTLLLDFANSLISK
jgi:glutamine amidotransferase PdxT